MGNWICTDPDTFQWQRHLGGRKYEMCEAQQVGQNGEPLNARYAVHAVIDVEEYDGDFYKIKEGPYDNYIEYLHALYGLDEPQPDNIVAEMIFETNDDDIAETVTDLLRGLAACSYITEHYLIDA